MIGTSYYITIDHILSYIPWKLCYGRIRQRVSAFQICPGSKSGIQETTGHRIGLFGKKHQQVLGTFYSNLSNFYKIQKNVDYHAMRLMKPRGH